MSYVLGQPITLPASVKRPVTVTSIGLDCWTVLEILKGLTGRGLDSSRHMSTRWKEGRRPITLINAVNAEDAGIVWEERAGPWVA